MSPKRSQPSLQTPQRSRPASVNQINIFLRVSQSKAKRFQTLQQNVRVECEPKSLVAKMPPRPPKPGKDQGRVIITADNRSRVAQEQRRHDKRYVLIPTRTMSMFETVPLIQDIADDEQANDE